MTNKHASLREAFDAMVNNTDFQDAVVFRSEAQMVNVLKAYGWAGGNWDNKGFAAATMLEYSIARAGLQTIKKWNDSDNDEWRAMKSRPSRVMTKNQWLRETFRSDCE